MKKETNAVDDFFRKSLQDYKVTPSETARSRFMDEASLKSGKGRFNLLRWYNILAVAVILTASAFLFSYFSKQNAPVSDNGLANPSAHNTINSGQNPDSLKQIKSKFLSSVSQFDSSAQYEAVNRTKTVIQRSPSSISKEKVNPEKTATLIPVVPNHATEQLTLAIPRQDKTTIPEHQPKIIEDLVIRNDQNRAFADTAVLVPESLPETGQNAPNTSDTNSSGYSSVDQPEPLPAGIPPTPEFKLNAFLLYTLDWNMKNTGNSLVHSLNLEGKVQYKRFSFTTGVGVTATSGFDNYEVQYTDYLGTYRKLDSITFAYDSKQYYLEPTYYLSDVNVWDSTLKLDTYQVKKRYSQLKIPLLLGYDILSRNKFVFGLKTGVEMYFYLNSHTISRSEYDAGMNKLVSTNQVSDDLTRNNIWLMANLFAEYRITRRLVIEVEPQMKYFLNPGKSGSTKSQQVFVPALRTSVKIKL